MRRALFFLAIMVIAASCGGDGTDPTTDDESRQEPFAVVASRDLAVGENRFLIAFRAFDGTPLGSPTEPLELTAFPQGRREEARTVDGTFLWIVPDVTGLYRANFDFESSGFWEVEARLGDQEIPIADFVVRDEPTTVGLGEPAPTSVTPTGSDQPLNQITSDPNPDPRLYELSVGQALQSGRPTVIAFATPAFCTTQACGPMVDQLKVLADTRGEVNWIHVEVFENLQDPANLSYVPAVAEWGLPTEPWLFVVDSAGIVRAKFEGAVDVTEVTDALADL